MEINFRNAAKAWIVEDGKVLMVKRRADDPHKPGAWDIPGGRLELGEDPFEGLKRETKEEIKCEIEILMPLSVNHFTRDDGQKITLTIYLCKLLTNAIELSEEHQEYRWVSLDNPEIEIPVFFNPTIHNFKKYIMLQ